MIPSVSCRQIVLTKGVTCGVMLVMYADLCHIGMLSLYKEGADSDRLSDRCTVRNAHCTT